MRYDINNVVYPAQGAKGKPSTSIYKNKVPKKATTEKTRQKRLLQVDTHIKEGMIPPVMVTVVK